MNWTTPLRAQQVDFIERLKSGHLLHCEIEGKHSELTVISGNKLKQLREFCWEMADKYKRTSSAIKDLQKAANLYEKQCDDEGYQTVIDMLRQVHECPV